MNESIIIAKKIYHKAELFLIRGKILLLVFYNLKQEISSFCFNKQEKLYHFIYKSLSKFFTEEVDKILTTEKETGISCFQRFKESLGYPTITSLRKYLKSYQRLIDTGISEITIPNNLTDFKEHLFGLAKYYNS